jgi:hypothetical protein
MTDPALRSFGTCVVCLADARVFVSRFAAKGTRTFGLGITFLVRGGVF